VPGQCADHVAGLTGRRIREIPRDTDVGIELPEGLVDPCGAAQDGVFACDDRCLRVAVVWNQRGREVAFADVFGERPGH
jgi:hypothetical protein